MKNQFWKYGLATHIGNVKDFNEDRAFIRIGSGSGNYAIALVADGMGGYQAGDVASQLAVDEMKNWWDHSIADLMNDSLRFEAVGASLREAFLKINERLLRMSQEEGIRAGTTLSVLLLLKDKYLIGHVGDSRIYQLSVDGNDVEEMDTLDLAEPVKIEKGIQQLTVDHSWVETQVKKGLLSKEQARKHPKRNVLMQCLGVEGVPTVYLQEGSVHDDAVYLLCSDGFYSLFSDRRIRMKVKHLVAQYDLQKVSEELVKMANDQGATDNITVVLMRRGVEDEKERAGFRKVMGRMAFRKGDG